MSGCIEFVSRPNWGILMPRFAMCRTLLARRSLALHEEIKVHSRHLERVAAKAALQSLEGFGIGVDTTADGAARRHAQEVLERSTRARAFGDIGVAQTDRYLGSGIHYVGRKGPRGGHGEKRLILANPRNSTN